MAIVRVVRADRAAPVDRAAIVAPVRADSLANVVRADRVAPADRAVLAVDPEARVVPAVRARWRRLILKS
jgi:hypothetical protein